MKKRKIILLLLFIILFRVIEFTYLLGLNSQEKVCERFITCLMTFILYSFPYIICIGLILIIILLLLSKNNEFIITSDNKQEENFDEDLFIIKKIYEFIQLQEAWMNFDYDKLHENITDELYNQYKMQLETLKTKKQKNIIKDIHPLDYRIISIDKQNNRTSIKAELLVRMKDYITQEGKIIRGTLEPITVKYILSYLKEHKTNKCPNCNGKLEEKSQNKCKYCGSIIRNTNDFVLCKKEISGRKNI